MLHIRGIVMGDFFGPNGGGMTSLDYLQGWHSSRGFLLANLENAVFLATAPPTS